MTQISNTIRIYGTDADGNSVPILVGTDGKVSVSSTGSGGGAVTIANGDDATLGAIADAAVAAGATGTVSAKLRRISTDLSTLLAQSPASSIVTVSSEITRPANTTAYTALDAISDSTTAPTVITFTNMARANGGSGYITKAQLATDQKTNTARYRLHLFKVASTAINDNSPYLTLYANIANRIGVIDFPAAATEDPTNSTQAVSQVVVGSGNLPIPFVCDSADDNLYGILETLDAFTPASGQKITIKLTADQN